MKTLVTTATALLVLASTVLADDKAIESARSHLGNVLKADFKKLEESYAAEVTLMPGHEFLKPEYGLATAQGRSKATPVERKRLIDAMAKAAEGKPGRDPEKAAALMESLKFEALAVKAGDFVVGSSDPVGTPDSKLRFTIKEGDVLVKAAPPKGDFVLFQLRKDAGQWGDEKWRVVAEYLD